MAHKHHRHTSYFKLKIAGSNTSKEASLDADFAAVARDIDGQRARCDGERKKGLESAMILYCMLSADGMIDLCFVFCRGC
jgi:hypothetical protein